MKLNFAEMKIFKFHKKKFNYIKLKTLIYFSITKKWHMNEWLSFKLDKKIDKIDIY